MLNFIRRSIPFFFVTICVCGFVFAQDKDDAAEKKKEDAKKKPKYTVEQVMEQAFKGGGKSLVTKVKKGKATDKEKMAVLDMFVSLVENKPPKGEMASWQKLSGTAALAAAKVVVGREGAMEEFGKATNCKACHEPHRPKAKKKS